MTFPAGSEARAAVQGAEWWLQHREQREDIGFHYDKDEGAASIEGRMLFPVLSTITYLRDVGAPTLILNQSTDESGAVEMPEIATAGVLVYPRKNKHVVFRSDLMHGCSGRLTLRSSAAALTPVTRLTLLINWWQRQPIPPNCLPVAGKDLKKMKELTRASALRELTAKLMAARADQDEQPELQAQQLQQSRQRRVTKRKRLAGEREISLALVDTAEEERAQETLSRFRISLPPDTPFYFTLPDRMLPEAPGDVGGDFAIRWAPQHTAGALVPFDMSNAPVMNNFRRSDRPCVLLFTTPSMAERVTSAALPVVRDFVDAAKFYLVNSADAPSAFDEFAVAMDAAPQALLVRWPSSRVYMARGRLRELLGGGTSSSAAAGGSSAAAESGLRSWLAETLAQLPHP